MICSGTDYRRLTVTSDICGNIYVDSSDDTGTTTCSYYGGEYGDCIYDLCDQNNDENWKFSDFFKKWRSHYETVPVKINAKSLAIYKKNQENRAKITQELKKVNKINKIRC